MEQMNFIVTTGLKATSDLIANARKTAEALGGRFIFRENLSIDALKEKYRVEMIVLATKKGLVANTPEGELFFHLNMAYLRIKNLRAGKPDNMVEAMGLHEGMSVLDCTLGLASDAIMSSFVVRGGGKVVGLEISPATAWIVQEGLKRFKAEDDEIKAAMGRIEVVRTDYLSYLRAQEKDSVDIVYFDPMFRDPIRRSVHLKPMRFVADHREVTLEAITEAKRVARRRVVIKEGNGSREFERLRVSFVVGGKYSSVQYGVIDANEA